MAIYCYILKMARFAHKRVNLNESSSAFCKNNFIITERQIRADLKKEKVKDFEDTMTYRGISKLYQEKPVKSQFMR